MAAVLKYKGNKQQNVSLTKSFLDTISFVSMKEQLEPMRPLVTSLQGKLAQMKFEFKKTEEIIHIYENRRENVSERFQLAYAKAVTLPNKFGAEEKQPSFYGEQVNISSEAVK